MSSRSTKVAWSIRYGPIRCCAARGRSLTSRAWLWSIMSRVSSSTASSMHWSCHTHHAYSSGEPDICSDAQNIAS